MLGIVILNYNTWEDSLKCINSIDYKGDYKVFLVDNNSNIECPIDIRKQISEKKEVIRIDNKVNSGYAAGNNIGILKAIDNGCSKILISNSDVIFKQDAIKIMEDTINSDLNIGMVGPAIYFPNGKQDKIRIKGKFTIEKRWRFLTFLSFLFKKEMKDFYQLNNNDDIIKSYTLPGCCLMLRVNDLIEIGMFDEKTFLYEEENILGIKISDLGKNVFQVKEAMIIHYHGKSTRTIRAFSYMHSVKSEIYFCRTYDNATIRQIKKLTFYRKVVYFLRTLFYKDYRKKRKIFKKEIRESLKMLGGKHGNEF